MYQTNSIGNRHTVYATIENGAEERTPISKRHMVHATIKNEADDIPEKNKNQFPV